VRSRSAVRQMTDYFLRQNRLGVFHNGVGGVATVFIVL
jgi:hypothetical protein